MGKLKGKDDTFLMKKQTEQEQSSTTIMISVDGKEIFWKSFFQWSFTYEDNRLNNDIKN